MIHSASPQPPPSSDCRLMLKFWDGRTYALTLCVKIVMAVVGHVDQLDRQRVESYSFPLLTMLFVQQTSF